MIRLSQANKRAGKKRLKVTDRLLRANRSVTFATFSRHQIDARHTAIFNEFSKLIDLRAEQSQVAYRLRSRSSSNRRKGERIVAKQILQPIGRDHGIETAFPCLETGPRLNLSQKIVRIIEMLAVYLQSRRQPTTVKSFIPRGSYERESRLEFEKFIHW